MAKSSFQNLRVYQLSETLADAVWDAVRRWERFPRDTIGAQLVRAADSVGANIAEGSARGSYQDNRRFVRIARASLAEVQHWLRRSYKRGLLPAEDVDRIKSTIDELAPKLNAYLRSIGQPSQRSPQELSNH
jgi:four helix bundle protein